MTRHSLRLDRSLRSLDAVSALLAAVALCMIGPLVLEAKPQGYDRCSGP
jgi:hypothetical protein